MTNLNMQATVHAQKNMAERIEREVIGAWRAGYNHLYVAPDIDTETTDGKLKLAMNVSYKALPKKEPVNQNPFEANMMEYDLTDLTAEKVESLQ